MLKQGDHGPQVLTLQRQLAALGHDPGPLDGQLGAKTLAAVQGFLAAGAPLDAILDEVLAAIGRAYEQQPKGIDVSDNNGEVDWPAVAASGIVFAYARALEPLRGKDKQYDRNKAGAKKAGLLFGAYWVLHPGRDVRQQFEEFRHIAGPREPGDLPPMLDVEVTDGQDPAHVAAAAHQALDLLREAYGDAWLYSYPGFAADYAPLAGWELFWLADYRGKPTPPPGFVWRMWQELGQEGRCPGVLGGKGPCDINRFRGSLASLRGLAVP